MVNLSSIIFISPFTSPRQINAVDAPLVASQAAGFSCKAEGFSADSFQLFGLRLEFWFGKTSKAILHVPTSVPAVPLVFVLLGMGGFRLGVGRLAATSVFYSIYSRSINL